MDGVSLPYFLSVDDLYDGTIRTMTDTDTTRLVGGNSDATRLAGESYRTRFAPNSPAITSDWTDLTPEAYLSKLNRELGIDRNDGSEFHNVGDKIGGRYEVLAIHHGAMGVVYGCFDHETNLPRALKTVRPEHAKNQQVISLFESEAAIWVSLEKHPNIVRAYLVEQFYNGANELPYVITEYILGQNGMGGDLRGWLGHDRLTIPAATGIALQIAQGMQHAVHKVPNLVHRDLKPGNILVNRDGKAMVTDFGLVNAGESDAGTPAYMSPEQWRKKALDARSDIYSFGCILFEMFTAHRLFPALSDHDWEIAHLEETPVSLISLTPEIPGEIGEFVFRCLSKDAERRPQSWDDVVMFFAEWHHRLTGNAVILDFSSLVLDQDEFNSAGYSLLNVWRFEEAIQVFRKVLEIDPDDEYAWHQIGYSFYCLNRYKEAIDAYDRALEISPADENTQFGRGLAVDCLAQEDERSKWTPEMHRAEDLREDLREEARKWLTVGGKLRNLQRYEEAIRVFDRATIDPFCGGAWCGKGYCYSSLQRHEEAIEAFNKAIFMNQNNQAAWAHKGRALHDLKRYEEAIQAYDRALAIKPSVELALKGKEAAIESLKNIE